MAAETKQDILNDIARLIGGKPRAVSRGSTEPREAFDDIVNALGLKVQPGLTKPQLAGAIARAGGQAWDDTCHSGNTPSGGGGTITLTGDRRVREAVRQLIAARTIVPSPTPQPLAMPRQIALPGIAEEVDAYGREEDPDYGSAGGIRWEPVGNIASQVREGAFRVVSDGESQRLLVNRALRGHFATVQRLKVAVEATGATTSQGHGSVDLRADWPDEFQLIAEVKTVPGQEVGRVRLGLAQLFEYRFRAGLPTDTPLLLVFDRRLIGPHWLSSFVTDDRKVNLVWWDDRFHVRGPDADELIRRINGSTRA